MSMVTQMMKSVAIQSDHYDKKVVDTADNDQGINHDLMNKDKSFINDTSDHDTINSIKMDNTGF